MSSPKLRLVKPDPTPQKIVRSLNESEKTEVKMAKLFASWAESQAIYVQEKNSGFSGMETSGKQIKPIISQHWLHSFYQYCQTVAKDQDIVN